MIDFFFSFLVNHAFYIFNGIVILMALGVGMAVIEKIRSFIQKHNKNHG